MRKIEKQIELNEEKVKQFTLNITYDSNFKKFAEENNSHSFRIVVDSNICRVDLPEHQIPEVPNPGIAAIDP
jgi:hypothetical protein